MRLSLYTDGDGRLVPEVLLPLQRDKSHYRDFWSKKFMKTLLGFVLDTVVTYLFTPPVII